MSSFRLDKEDLICNNFLDVAYITHMCERMLILNVYTPAQHHLFSLSVFFNCLAHQHI